MSTASSTLRSAWRNFSTLFLLAALVAVPLHTVVSFTARRVIEVKELLAEIETWPEEREIAGIGRGDLAWYRRGLLVISCVQIVLLPLFVRAGRRALDTDRLGGVPTVIGSLRRSRAAAEGLDYAAPRHAVFPIFTGIVVWAIARAIGRTVVDFIPSESSWAALALFDAAAISLAAPFVLTGLAYTSAFRGPRRDRLQAGR